MPYNPNTHTNTGTAAVVDITNSSFTGNVVNTGTINPGGIVISHSSIAGSIQDDGAIVGGISLDRNTTLNADNAPAIFISAHTFAGGVTNAGAISAAETGIFVAVDTFGGSVINSAGGIITAITFNSAGNILAGSAGIAVAAGTFLDGVTNAGVISALTGIRVRGGTFAGSIVNKAGGVINSNSSGILALGARLGGQQRRHQRYPAVHQQRRHIRVCQRRRPR